MNRFSINEQSKKSVKGKFSWILLKFIKEGLGRYEIEYQDF